MTLITDYHFYLIAVPVVLLYGMAKGGLGPAIGTLAVPLLSLVISPVTAAAIMLPILCVMDIVAISRFKASFSKPHLKLLLPAGICGIGIATLFMGKMPPETIKIFIAVISILFCLDYWFRKDQSASWIISRPAGIFWGVLSGFTSAQIHAGGPPISIYLLPQKIDKVVLMGTIAIYFAAMNFIKLIPYSFMGFLNFSNLLTSLILIPIAPFGVLLGNFLLKKIEQKTIYRYLYIALFLSSLKLLWDGISHLS